jgi:hypothetical protein
MIDLSSFGYVFDSNNSNYFNFFDDLEVNIRTGIDYSYPESPNLDINDYKEVAFQVNYTIEKRNTNLSVEDFLCKMNNKELNLMFTTAMIASPIDILVSLKELDLLLSCINNYVDSSKKGICNPLPCCKCKLNDKWNSLGKDNQWYCYQHCDY